MPFDVVEFFNSFMFILWRTQAFAKNNVNRSFGEAGTLTLNYHARALQLPPVVATLYAHWMHIICTEVLGIQNSEKSRLDPVDF